METNAGTRKVVLITGAAKRVGATIARTLHAAGCDLALHYRRSRGEMDALIGELEAQRAHSTLAVSAELADIEHLPRLIDACIARYGRLDGLVNNASAFYPTPIGTKTASNAPSISANSVA